MRANHAEYMTKHLRKAIMRRSALESKFHKYGTAEHNKAYKKQNNIAVDCIKRNVGSTTTTWIIKKSLTINKFGRQLNLSFLIKDKLATK